VIIYLVGVIVVRWLQAVVCFLRPRWMSWLSHVMQ